METLYYIRFIDAHSGLNRTMQYGNNSGKTLVTSPDTMFKSYYVVWKPRRNETEIYDGQQVVRECNSSYKNPSVF